MPSLDFECEKKKFRTFYDTNRVILEEAKNACISAVVLLLKQFDLGEITKVEGRVKNREECIKKFQRKYQSRLESDEQPYEIKDYLSDLIGIRVVCIYEDQISHIADALGGQFDILNITDKISLQEKTPNMFGYKGLHMDVEYNEKINTSAAVEHQVLFGIKFEVQIRSLIQDAWSVLDHKIKYKKSIPADLKRRINVLAALFELADREFIEIRNATSALLQQETEIPFAENQEAGDIKQVASASTKQINAFNFLRVASHFFKDFDFKDYKVDNFVQEILRLDKNFSRSDLHQGLVDHIKKVKEYREEFLARNPDFSFGPYTIIRHCLYLHDQVHLDRILSRGPRERFKKWLEGGSY